MNVSVNRASSLTPAPSGGASRGDQGGLAVVFLVLLFATFLFSANSAAGQRSAIAGVVVFLLFPIVWFVPRVGLPAVIAFLMMMGGFRRFLIPLLGYTELDPMLLVSPVVATICFVNFAIKKQLRPTTQLSKWTLSLMLLMGLAVANPLQGGPLVGLTGAAFYLVPLMWYCVGRNFGSPQTVKMIMRVTLTVSVLGAILGLKQHFFGFSSAELEWFQNSRFTNAVGGTQRPMSFFTSPAEYVNFLSIGIIVCFCNYLRGQKGFVFLALFLGYAMFLSGIRGIVVCCVGACTLMWAVQERETRRWIPRIIIAALVVGVGGVLGLQQIGAVAESVGGGSSGAEMVNHQIQGLTDPLAKGSSAHGHIDNIKIALTSGLKMPIGYGLGASTMGSARFGGSATFTAETDLPTIFYSLGVIGGIVFVGMIVVCFRAAGLYWYHTRSYTPLVIVGALVSSNGNWLTAGHYAQSVIVWILIGCLDRCWNDGKGVPGYIQTIKQSKGSIAIWKRALSRRLSGAEPSWGASYRRAGNRRAVPVLQSVQSASGEPETVPKTAAGRLTPSAERALARQAASDANTESRAREQA